MRIKVVSDGTRIGTTVVDAATGEGFGGIVAVRWEIGHGDSQAFAFIKARVDLDVEAEVRPSENDQARKGWWARTLGMLRTAA